jgi:large subunit ribosomal protein L3
MKFILGKKLEMTQVWLDEQVVPVTKVQAGPCMVVQVKQEKQDGYDAVQVGYDRKKEKNINKPQRGHLAKLKTRNSNANTSLKYLREFRIAKSQSNFKIGDSIDVSTFEPGDKVKVTGAAKGKGFQGVVKRHGFKGAPASHGTKDQLRMPGSIGATGPAKVFKGKKMPGRMGGNRVTVTNLEILKVDKDNNILLIKGAVPGARNGLLLIQGEGELKIVQEQTADDSQHKKIDKPVTAESAEDKKVVADKKEEQINKEEEKAEAEKEQASIKNETETKGEDKK